MRDWIKETELAQGGVEFRVRQLQFKPLLNLGWMILMCVTFVGVLAALMPVTGGVTGIFATIFGFVFAFAILMGTIVALSAAIFRSGKSVIQVSLEGISIIRGGRKRSFERSGIMKVSYLQNNNIEVDGGAAAQRSGGGIGATSGRAAASAGASAGQMAAMVMNGCSASVTMNYKGKQIPLARFLSDDQAEFLH